MSTFIPHAIVAVKTEKVDMQVKVLRMKRKTMLEVGRVQDGVERGNKTFDTMLTHVLEIVAGAPTDEHGNPMTITEMAEEAYYTEELSQLLSGWMVESGLKKADQGN